MGGNYQRTKKGMRNSIVAVMVQIVSLLLGFFSRKIFLDYLGTEVLGLNTTAASLLNFLNLAEMGIEVAVAYTLYKPLFEKDETSIREIIAIQGWFYKRVALFIIVGSILLLPFFPLIFTKMQLPLWYAYASYLVLLFSSLLGYFVNYKQVILTADQQDWKFQMSYRITMIVKVCFQMFAVRCLEHPYEWWLAIEALFAILAAILLNYSVYRNYPFLKASCKVSREMLGKYPQILPKVKQIFIHRIGFFVTTQAAPILIYTFTSLTTVAIYGNYKVVMDSMGALIVAAFANLNAGIGNTVAEGDQKLVYKIFKELFTARFALILFGCVGVWLLMEPFIKLWIGPEFLLGNGTLILIVAVFFLSMMNHSSESFLNAYGLFNDIWVPFVRSAIYLVLGILLGRSYGLNGILTASVIDNFWVSFIWKPYFLFRNGLRQVFSDYLRFYFKLLFAGAVAVSLLYFTVRIFSLNPGEGVLPLIRFALIVMAVFGVSLLLTLGLFEKSTISFLTRIKNSISK